MQRAQKHAKAQVPTELIRGRLKNSTCKRNLQNPRARNIFILHLERILIKLLICMQTKFFLNLTKNTRVFLCVYSPHPSKRVLRNYSTISPYCFVVSKIKGHVSHFAAFSFSELAIIVNSD